jgi:hypothetical protein
MVEVNVTQYMDRLRELELPNYDRDQAETNLKVMLEGFKGHHRWDKIGPALQVLLTIGKGVYEKVALPLLAELAKKAAGL